MTEEHIKEMLNGIINNGEKWECRPPARCAKCYPSCVLCAWRPYKLGVEIHPDWEYRKVPLFCVLELKDSEYICGFKEALLSPETANIVFEGSKEECEKWIEEHTKKSWLEEKINDYWNLNHTVCEIFSNDEKGAVFLASKDMAKEVCKKIMEECTIMWNQIENDDRDLKPCDIKTIIKELGVELQEQNNGTDRT